jgi:magnesium-protoporphyrin O-methyltransferase
MYNPEEESEVKVAEASLDCSSCEGLEGETVRWAQDDLANYRRGKLVKTTPMLIRALVDMGVQDLTLLDIGGGVGAVQLDLLRAGASHATSVDASKAYLAVAKEEASRASLEQRITYVYGDFVTVAGDIPEADIVTLDRVICCYADVETLVSRSAAKARKVYGLVFPRDVWWMKLALFFENLGYRIKGSPFRAFAHPTELVQGLLRSAGLNEVHHRNTFAWQVVLYQRSSTVKA